MFERTVDAYVQTLASGGFRTWEEYKKHRLSAWIYVRVGSSCRCNCPTFVKRGQCKHSIGMQIERGEVTVPLEAQSVPLGQKRKRGRLAKVTGALVR